MQLALVGEDQIDGLLANELKKLAAIAVDAEGVRQRERNEPAGAMRDPGRLEECLLGAWRIPQVALEIGDLGGRDHVGIDVVGMQILRGAQERVHGALAVRRDQNEAARSRRAVGGRRCLEGDAGRANVMREHTAKLVVLDLAHERRPRAEARDPDRGIGGRAA